MSESHPTQTYLFNQEEPKKRCGRCQKTKPLSCFGKSGKQRRCYCFDCRRRRPVSQRMDIRDRKEKCCPRCREIKPIAEFRKIGQGDNREAPVSHYCRSCNRVECQERMRVKIKSGKAREEYKEAYKKKRWKKLLAQYGISRETYEAMERAQNGRCAICGFPETVTYKDVLCRLVVDHDHVTNRVRGLLCRACNVALGNFRDDQIRLQKAIDYLNLYRQDER